MRPPDHRASSAPFRGRESRVDAIVMATAARRGGVVFTSDVDDLTRLREVFPNVRVLGV